MSARSRARRGRRSPPRPPRRCRRHRCRVGPCPARARRGRPRSRRPCRSRRPSRPAGPGPPGRSDSVRLSPGLMQLVAVDDVAAAVAELATGTPVGGPVELGGPEALGIDAWARRLFAATGDQRTVVTDPHARYFGAELHGGELTPGGGGRIGAIDFDTWFTTQYQGAVR